MIKRITNLKNNKLLKNFSYLTIIELSNYILPFITIPHIVRVVGVENFGIITFTYAFVAYFQLIVNYGFRLIATKYISINRDNINKISKYFWTIIFSQLLLFLLSTLIFIIVIFNIEKLSSEKLIFIYSFGLVISSIIFPIWFFQGMEDMKYIAIFNMISRSIYTVLIFIFIQDKSDYQIIPLFNSGSFILIGLISLIFIKYKFSLSFYLPSFNNIKEQLIEGWYLFISTITNNLYTTTNTVILGFMTNYTIVGVYSLASTIINAVTKIVKIFIQVIYPYLSKFSHNKELLIKKATKSLNIYLMILALLSLFLFLFSENIIILLFGENKEDSIFILKLLSISLLVEPLGAFFTSFLVIKNEKKVIAKITFKTMILNFLIVFPLIFFFEAIGMVITKILVESYQAYLNISKNKELINIRWSKK
jgi:polysaccharide transporter, PST family